MMSVRITTAMFAFVFGLSGISSTAAFADENPQRILRDPVRAVLKSDDPEVVADVLLEEARSGNAKAVAAVESGEIFEEAFFQAVRYQNGVLEPRDQALPFYAAALRDPQRRWHGITAFHVTELAEGLTTFGGPYETGAMASARWDRWHDWRKSRAGQLEAQLGETGHLRLEPGKMSAGDAFVAMVAATVALSIMDGLSGKAPLNDPSATVSQQDHMGELAKDLAIIEWVK